MTTTVQSSASSATFLAKGKKSIEEVLSTSSFIEDDIKTIISRISASAPDDIIVKLTSFISQLEASRSSNKIIPVKLNGPADIKDILEKQEKYITTYNLKANNLCPMVYIALPTILCKLLNIKLADNWNNKQHFTMPELIISVLTLTVNNNGFFPLIMKQEAIAYLTKYTPEIREFLAMAVLYIKTYKTVTFDRHRKKMYGLDNYFIPMSGSNTLKFSFSPGIVIDPQKASKAFYKVYIEYFHPGLLALTANIRAILSENNLSFEGGSQNFVETASIVYPYLDELLQGTKIALWEPFEKKKVIPKAKGDNKTRSARRNKLVADSVQKLPPVEAKDKPYTDQRMPLPREKPHKARTEPKIDPRTAGTSTASSLKVSKGEFVYEMYKGPNEELTLKHAQGFKSGGRTYYKLDSLYNQAGLRLFLDDYRLLHGSDVCYIGENAYLFKDGKKHYPFRHI
jgi:hypothetical protein